MDAAELRSRRLFAQGLRSGTDAPAAASGPPSTPADVVRRSLAVQGQEYLPSQWGLAQRLPLADRPDGASVGAAIDRGEILRTHVLRPTWHHVDPADARWLLEASAPRVGRIQATYERRYGIEGERAARALDAFAEAVAGGRHRTRAELAEVLDGQGWPGGAMVFLLIRAELDRVLISGASVGKQRTYAAFDERVPPSAPRPLDDALAELAERFLLTRGPASARDLSAWSGFTLRDVRAALADAADRTGGRIERLALDAESGAVGAAGADDLWHDASVAAAWSARERDAEASDDDPERVDLLQAYDEYIMGYASPRAYLQPPGIESPVIPEFPLHAMFAGGTMIGRWAWTQQGRRTTLRIVPWRGPSARELESRDAVIAEVEAFLGVPVAVEVDPVTPL
ncbi:winged helix DNA-binding domain-containing protein [Agromyces sp. LHK192]|uniref:winged helix DNA-binding domain-containing protein n=1 Tax=Agromyces sp. LHK192 TaxID=2498704 RepID=UPI000FDC7EE9|nr:winged helix DNA-binding domain-containing protein [Agromyces sp. LHK192]